MFNQDIKNEAKKAGVMLWQIAEKYNGGMTDSNFSRKLRKELPPQEKQKIFAIIAEIAKEVQFDDANNPKQ